MKTATLTRRASEWIYANWKFLQRLRNPEALVPERSSCTWRSPAVSIAVRKLEDSLGVTLFDRSSRSIELTAEGEQLLGPCAIDLATGAGTGPIRRLISRVCCEVS